MCGKQGLFIRAVLYSVAGERIIASVKPEGGMVIRLSP
jgi:hypothetical protein